MRACGLCMSVSVPVYAWPTHLARLQLEDDTSRWAAYEIANEAHRFGIEKLAI